VATLLCGNSRWKSLCANGNEVTHHVDISWNELWTGTDQTRLVTFDGDYVRLSTRPSPDPIEGKMSVRTMTWERWNSPLSRSGRSVQ
jgi:hypothetical protein